MGRIRTLRPEFPHSESMGRISREARLCFILLWTIADDSGRLRGNSRMLASLLFPYDVDAPKRIDGWLEELEGENCLRRYVVNNDNYVEICNWLKHQRIDKPSPSKIPPFDEHSSKPREDSPTIREDSSEEGKGREGKGKEVKAMSGYPPDVASLQEHKARQLRQQAIDLLIFLNTKTGRHFRPVDANLAPLIARLKSSSADDVRCVIAKKCREWAGDEKMIGYLRPATLFNRTKFEQYLGEIPPQIPLAEEASHA